MVRYEMKSLPQPSPEQLVGDTGHLTEPCQEHFLKSRVPPFLAISLPAHLGVERERHVIDIAGGEPGMIQAVTDRTLGKLMRVVEVRLLAVFDAIEPFFLDGRDEFTVDEQCRGRLVIH